MKIAVTTPTGHVGGAVADFLLGLGGDIQVKLLGRRPNTLKDFVERGAEAAIGSQDDPDYVTRATADVDALLWVTPPGYGSDNVRAFQNRLAKSAAAAVRANSVARVVNVSSIGAENGSGMGPINGLHDVEQILDNATENVLHLRPATFFENLLLHLDSIRIAGTISLPISGTKRMPMIATRDIGRVAAQRLLSRGWTGRHVRELHGPADLSFDEVAAVLSRVLGRKIAFKRCEPEQARQAIIGSGLSENIADLLLEMYDAFETGRLRPLQPRSADTTTPTTLSEFAREVMAPALAPALAHAVSR